MKKNYTLCLILSMFFAVVLSSCSKNETLSPPPPVSIAEFQEWMDDNVNQVTWTDPAYFYWQVLEMKLDNKTVSSRGIAYMSDPAPFVFPSIEQNLNESYMRTMEVGSPSPNWCAHYRESVTLVNLVVRTNSGKLFNWQNCPVKISEHETNPANLPWGVAIPKTIELIVADRQK